MKKVYLLGEVNPKLTILLKEVGIETTREISDFKSISAIVVRGEVPVDNRLINSFENLEIIISAGIGFDNIDIETATSKNIYVANCPYANSLSTAEHAVALLLAGSKNIVKATEQLRDGVWNRQDNIGTQIYGKKVGIVGLGRVGRYAAQLFAAIGMEVYGFDPFVPNYHFIRSRVRNTSSLVELFEMTNYVSVHLPRTDETTNIITLDLIRKLEKSNGLINTCRGGVVREDDVIKALNEEVLDFYAADVFEGEPANLNKDLISHPKVLATPHIAANTDDAQDQVLSDVFDELKRVLVDQIRPRYLVTEEHL